MLPFLNVVNQEYRADALRERAEHERRWLVARRDKRAARAETATPPALGARPALADRALLGREHGSPA